MPLSESPSTTLSTNTPKAWPPLTLEATAFTKPQLIHPEAPQLAFAGRSNVGKSSLLNALAGRKGLAKVSGTPGKTRSINYYRIGEGPAYLVDLPGYGYARCSKEEQARWAALLQYYFRATPGLAGLMLLVDSRLSPQKADKDLLAYAASLSLPIIPVLTKIDKCGKKELAACVRAWGALVDGRDLVLTSAAGKKGIAELWEAILGYLDPACGLSP